MVVVYVEEMVVVDLGVVEWVFDEVVVSFCYGVDIFR